MKTEIAAGDRVIIKTRKVAREYFVIRRGEYSALLSHDKNAIATRLCVPIKNLKKIV